MSVVDKLKEHAARVTETASSAAVATAAKTKQLASIGRVRIAIAAEEDKRKKAYTELGKLCYRDYAAKAAPAEEDYQPLYEKIADAEKQIDLLNAEIDRLKAEGVSDVQSAETDEEPSIEVDLTSDTEAAEEPTEEPEAEEAPAAQPEETPAEAQPTIGTLYVDETNAD